MTTPMPMTAEMAQEINEKQHPRCLFCHERTLPTDGTGRPLCGDKCEHEVADPVYDDEGNRIGWLHSGCYSSYLLMELTREIEDAFSIRAPLGMQPWIAERSRNLAQRLFFKFSVELKPKEDTNVEEG